LVLFLAAVLAVWISAWLPAARAAALDPQSLAPSLQSDPVQSIDVPPSSFAALSGTQIN
jgi:hypothetical protein